MAETKEAPWKKIIATELEKRTGRLDLGQCGLTAIPSEILEMDWLEELILGNNSFETSDFDYAKTNPGIHKMIFPNKHKPQFTTNEFSPNSLRSNRSLDQLKNLRYLNLYNCDARECYFLFRMPSLQVLILGKNENIINAENIIPPKGSAKYASTLQLLDISHCYIERAFFLNMDFPALQLLGMAKSTGSFLNNLGCEKSLLALNLGETDLKVHSSYPENISRYTQLKYLEMINCNSISIGFLSSLTKLEILGLSNNYLTDISPIAGLTKLKSVTLFSNQIKKIAAFRLLENLETARLDVNEIDDLDGIEKCYKLTTVFAGSNKITNLKPLTFLYKLKTLHIGNNQVVDLWPLLQLENLSSLELHSNKIESEIQVKRLLEKQPNIQLLSLYGNPIKSIPTTILGNNFDSNCLPQLRSYFASLQKGETINNEIKLILVGNSTAGKTTLRKMLQGKEYNAKEDSTHGITFETWTLTGAALQGISELPELKVHIWDFGGQEYYHETHRLFFSTHAVYVLVWEEETNKHEIIRTPVNEIKNGKQVTSEKYIEHQTYEYWLKNIRHYSPESPVILVQNKIDKQLEKRIEEEKKADPDVRLPLFHFRKAIDKIVEDFNVLHAFDLSLQNVSKNDQDYIHDYQKFERFLRKILVEKTSHFKLGKSYTDIKEIILSEKNKNTMNYGQYKKLVEDMDSDLDITDLTSYLTNTSVILYYNDIPALQQTVFINPIWVSDNIYKVLNEDVLQRSGRFDEAHVENILGNSARADEFVELMKKFQIIFEVNSKIAAPVNEAPAGAIPVLKKLIAPQYLPEGYTTRSYYLFKTKFGQPKFIVRFPKFIPKTIMNGLLSAYAGKAIDESYYRYGVAFENEDATNKSINIIECDYNQSEISFYSDVHDVINFRNIFESILLMVGIDIVEKSPPVPGSETNNESVKKSNAVIHLSVDGQTFIDWKNLFSNRQDFMSDREKMVLPVEGVQVKCEMFMPFYLTRSRLTSEKDRLKLLKEPPKIFISYSHKDEVYKNELVEQLSGLKMSGVIKEWNDRALRPGEKWDEGIKQNLEEADVILFLLSPSFIASEYISNVEIKRAMARHNEGRVKIIPIHIRPCDFSSLPLKDFQKIPADKWTVTDTSKYVTRDFAWEEILRSLKEEFKKIQEAKIS